MSEAKPKVVVVGSFMMDLVVKAERRPRKGETLIGDEFGMFIGGKGTNQAIAAARLGAQVDMIGRLGTDLFGDMFMSALNEEGINTQFIVRDREVGTGVGTPVIDAQGDNSIIIIPRANMRLTVEDVKKAENVIGVANVLLLQLEVPVESSQRAAEIAPRQIHIRALWVVQQGDLGGHGLTFFRGGFREWGTPRPARRPWARRRRAA